MKKGGIQLDLFTGRKFREAAMERVAKGTPPEWLAAMASAVMAVAREMSEFTTDEVWKKLGSQPREPRALGAVIMSLSRGGSIRRTGKFKQSKRPECHCRPLAVWEMAEEGK